MRYVIHDRNTGRILRQGVVPDGSDWHQLQVGADHEAVLVPPKGVPVDDTQHAVDLATGTIIDKPAPHPDETAAAAQAVLRRRRTQLLAASDWTQLADASLPPEARAAWAAYRRALRDLPANSPDPAKPVWPQAPGKE